MKIERLKKSHKKEIIIGGLIVLGIVSAITLTTSRAKYRLTQSIPIVRGTINYKPYDLKIMAMYKQKEGSTCTEDSCYDEITGEMPSSGYVVNENKTYCLTSNNEQVKGKIKTVNGTVTLTNLIKNDKCYIWFDKAPSTGEVLSKLNLSIADFNTASPDFTKIAINDCSASTCEASGKYRIEDGMYGGYSYYWRGEATTNHVIFADKCWRIIRINGDGTIRLIYNGAKLTGDTCTGNGVSNAGSIAVTNVKYTSGTNIEHPEYTGYTYTSGKQRPSSTTSGTPSTAKTQAETWFTNNIKGTNLSKVADGKFCNDRVAGSLAPWNKSKEFHYDALDRLITCTPTLNCHPEDVYNLKVGLITSDEAMLAGLTYTTTTPNTKSFLYNGHSFLTMSSSYYPFSVNVSSSGIPSVVHIFDGKTIGSVLVNGSSGIRPVINLRTDTTFKSGGLGTSDKPYIVAN